MKTAAGNERTPRGTAAATRRPAKAASRSPFFIFFIAIAIALVLAGFGRTFLVPLLRGTFSAPWFVYAHGALFFGWMGLLMTQALLALRRRMDWHRRLGASGFVLIPAMVASGLAVALWATRRDVAAGQAQEALPFFFGQCMDMLLFATLASAALWLRANPAMHKRLVLLATLAILGAAIGRIPELGVVANGVVIGLLAGMAVFDLHGTGRIHRATSLGGSWLLAGSFLQEPLGSTAAWMAVAQRIVG